MPIKIQHGTVESIAKLGLLAGQSVAAQREIERAQDIKERAMQIAHDEQMFKFRAQLDLQAAMRSQEWEMEKMEVRSRLDFERSEKERIRKLDDVDNALRQIDREVEAGRITEVQANALKFRQEMKKYGAAPPVSLIQPPTEEREVSLAQQMSAIKYLRKEEFKEPTGWEKFLHETTFGAYGKEELTEDEKFYREMFEQTARGIPSGTISSPAVQVPTGAFKIGQEIERGGIKYKVVGFDTDGMPLVEPI